MTAVVPSTSNSPVGAPPSQSTSRKLSISPKERAPHAMATRSAFRPSPTSASGSKCSSNATSSNASHRSKRQKVDGAASADLSMLQCASYALEMLSHGGLRSHVISALVTDDTIQLYITTVRSSSYCDQLIFWKTPHDLLQCCMQLPISRCHI
jgi:hypothetical protein